MTSESFCLACKRGEHDDCSMSTSCPCPCPGDRASVVDLGTCCLCGQDGATVLLMLAARSPIAGHGWSCLTCGLEANGALAVLCQACAEVYERPGAESVELSLQWACRGYPGTEGRIRFEKLRGEHQHVRHRHPELGPMTPLQPLPTDTRWGQHTEEGRGCLCSRCHQTIFEGTIALRMWPEHGEWQYCYHPVCCGAEPRPWEAPYSKEQPLCPRQ